MTLPIVSIVGRPNVGKSSLLNALARRRISIVDPTAGVTRDRISTILELDDRYIELVDTGGYGIEDSDNLTEHVERQIAFAIERSQLILFVVDVREGVVTLDRKVAELLRKQGPLQVLLVANKADSPNQDDLGGELFKLGFGEPIFVSALHARNRDGLARAVLERLPDDGQGDYAQPVMKLAIVGKRNVGKSTFTNTLAGEERVIVSEVPGTTRDAVDVRFERDGHSFIAIDTAGLRKKGRMTNESIEFYSYSRATRSIRRADVVLFFLDASQPLSQVDKRLAHAITEEFKPCIIVINKWDLAKDHATTDEYAEYLDRVLPGLTYPPISFITASQGKNVQSLLDLATQLFKQASTTVTTAQINKAIQAVVQERVPSARKKVGFPKIYYGTQVATHPPTILLFVNNPAYLDENYRRYLLNRFRDVLPFSEVPIRLFFRHHHGEKRAGGRSGASSGPARGRGSSQHRGPSHGRSRQQPNSRRSHGKRPPRPGH